MGFLKKKENITNNGITIIFEIPVSADQLSQKNGCKKKFFNPDLNSGQNEKK
jgi:hypothetical protein